MIIDRKYLRGVSLRDTSIPRIYLRGEAGGAPISFEGYPLALSLPNARSMRTYTLFGNTSEDAKGVGDEVVQMVKTIDPANFSALTRVEIKDGKYCVAPDGSGSAYWGSATLKPSDRKKLKYGSKYLAIINVTSFSLKSASAIYVQFGKSPSLTVGDIKVEGVGRWAAVLIPTESSAGDLVNITYNTKTSAILLTNEDKFEFTDVNVFDLTAMGMDDVITPDEFARRKGWKDAASLPAFPYGSSFVAPIRVGSRNLVNPSAVTPRTWLNINGETEEQGSYSVTEFIRVTPGKVYSISARGTSRTKFYNSAKVALTASWDVDSGVFRFTVPSGVAYIRFTFLTSLASSQFLTIGANGEYVPYFAPTLYPSVLSSPLHKIGDIVDYKESNGKEWHGCASYTFTGEENWTWEPNGQRWQIPSNVLPDIVRMATNNPDKVVTSKGLRVGSTFQTDGFYLAYNAIQFRDIENFPQSAGSTAVKDFVRGMEVVFALATPTEVQGEPLPRLAIPKGESIVTLDTAVEPSNIKAKV